MNDDRYLGSGVFKASDLVECYRPPFLAQVFEGNRVMLASGGPEMIVSSVSGDQVLCSWEVAGKLMQEHFHIRVLTCYGAK